MLRLATAVAVTLIAVALVPGTASAADVFSSYPAAGFQLQREGLGPKRYALIKQLAVVYPRAGAKTVIADVNLRTRPLRRGKRGKLGRPLRGVRGITSGYRFNVKDSASGEWTPQGLTGADDADVAQGVNKARVQVVSWYRGKNTDSRLSFVDRDKGRYRHVLLVNPRTGGGFGPVNVHAGGIAWVGKYMYVVDTGGGIRVFDTKWILRVPKAQRDEKTTFGVKYVLPQVGIYRRAGSSPLRFSAVSFERPSLPPGVQGPPAPPSLVVSEFLPDSAKHGKVVRWPLNGESLIAQPQASQAYESGSLVQLQGVLSLRGKLVATSSVGKGNGKLFYGPPGAKVTQRRWARSPEGLYYSPSTNEIFNLAEQPKERAVFGINASKLGI